MEAPETRYVAVGGSDVAYQVVGDGPIDILYCNGLGSHIEHFWEGRDWSAQELIRLASFSRLIFFDRRGLGASDRFSTGSMPTWEEWTEDIAAVLDVAGSKRTAIWAGTDAGPIAMLFAAMHPDIVSALVLLNTSARYLEADDYPIGESVQTVDGIVDLVGRGWGTTDFARLVIPGYADDQELLRRVSKMQRASATPRSAAAQYDYILRSLDVRQALPLVQAPTLVLHVRDSPFLPVAHGRYLAEHIEGATLVELPGGDLGYGPETAMEVEEFLTGQRPTIEVDRILTTVLFTDIVGSTARAASLGDRRWLSLLDAHDKAVRDELRRFRGREITTTGDGFVASFDGPARAVRCAQAIVGSTGKLGIEIRAGLHTGECEVRGGDLGGLAVHIAARVGDSASPRRVFVSGTVKDLVVGSGIEFEDRGEHDLKGVPGTWKLFSVRG
jgi:class 3 adenylate cyclase/pimeloyl-ACP methyl ester carboxylesterase